jgi:hypothetical protein
MIDHRQVVLDRIQLAARAEMADRGFRCDLDFYADVDRHTHRLVLTIAATMLGRQRDETTTVRWPADWVQALKARFLPQRLLKRWPVRYAERVVATRVVRVCPHMNVPQHGPHVCYLADLPTEDSVA